MASTSYLPSTDDIVMRRLDGIRGIGRQISNVLDRGDFPTETAIERLKYLCIELDQDCDSIEENVDPLR